MKKAIGASSGISIGKIFKYEELEIVIDINPNGNEIEKFNQAIVKTEKQLEIIKEKTLKNLDEEHALIFDAHILVLKDPELVNGVISKIESEDVSAAHALKCISGNFITFFEGMDNEYMRERAADIKDVTHRLLANLTNQKLTDLSLIDEEVIIVANDLTPSDTAVLNKDLVKGFITEIGGKTSHSAIMARSLEIPAIVGAKGIMSEVNDGDIAIFDGTTGEVIINPESTVIDVYQQKRKEYYDNKKLLLKYKDLETVTACGKHLEVAANIGSVDDLDGALANGAEGIGLFRTEFLYMSKKDFPTEEEQFLVYKEVLERMENKPVVVRTLDIGGDKELPYLDMPKEMNPFLGYRAIRLCLDRKELFITQLRALVRASAFGNLRIMFPMIATVNEFKEAKSVLEEVKESLINDGVKVGEYQVGMMVEIPAAAILADQFANYADFFSIGTNDLIQYTFAADRMNEHVSYLYQPLNPSLLRLIDMVIKAAHAKGKWVGMCGELAGSAEALPILLGLGLDEFSMSASSILGTRKLISEYQLSETQEISKKALECQSYEEVQEIVRRK